MLKNQAWRRIRAAYYTFGLSHLPFGDALGRAVSEWETAQGFGDSPKPQTTWDAEYASGRWNYMSELRERSRYSALIGYMTSRQGSYLDVGCGDGVLFERFKPFGFERYVGVDISTVAIGKLAHHNDSRTAFEQADADVYQPTESFDFVVFNESLYYLRDPVGSLLRYAQVLKPDGSILVSTYLESRRSRSVLRDAKRALTVVDETKTTQGRMSWLCTVLRPRDLRAQH